MLFLIKTLKHHFRHQLSIAAVLISLLLSGAFIALDQAFRIESIITSACAYTPAIYPIEFLKNAMVYYLAVFVLYIFRLIRIENPRKFLVISALGLLFYSVYSAFYAHISLIKLAAVPCRIWLHHVIENVSGLITLALPLWFLWRITQKKSINGFYGLHARNLTPLRYIDVMLLVVAAMYFAMHLPGLAEYYPVLDNSYFRVCAAYFQVPKWLTALGFEVSYALDFVWVELFFRGFLVLGMLRFLGKDAILPMAVLYVVIHFGKPIPEVISSFFGGYLLGVVAYHTQHIRAGILLHIVLAMSAEIFAILMRSY